MKKLIVIILFFSILALGVGCVATRRPATLGATAEKPIKPLQDSQVGTNLTSAEIKERLMLREKLQKGGFVSSTKGIYSKESISIKDLKALLEITDLKKAKPAPSVDLFSSMYSLKLKGGRCVIRSSDPSVDLSDDNTIVSVTVNTEIKKILPESKTNPDSKEDKIRGGQ